MKLRNTVSLFLILALCMGLCACAGSKAPANSVSTDTASPTPAEAPSSAEPPKESEAPAEPEIDSALPVNVMVLNGTTGFGMARLMSDAEKGDAALNYRFSVETDASNVTAALINGSADIAALPTNAASVLYNKTQGGVQLLAVNTLGVLYLVTDSEKLSISSLADLEGLTVYVPAQNPTFIFSALCSAVGVNVTIDNSYAQPADLRTAVAAGEADLAVLPEPMVTIAMSANEKLSAALDLTAEWDKVYPQGSLIQGCVAVRTDFAAQHGAEVRKFLEEYSDSIAFLAADTAEAGELIEQTGVFTNGKVAAKAIPNCNIVFLSGEDMKKSMSQFLDIMSTISPASIGGAVPGEDFYFIP